MYKIYNMEKIILKALSLAGFQNAEEITRVISSTPNPRVAAEMILGVYTPTELDPETLYRKHKYDSQKEFVEILEIDDLANTVKYNVFIQNTKWVYYLTREDKQAGIYHETRQSGSDYYDSGNIQTTGYTVNERTDTLDNFNEKYSKKISYAEVMQITTEWQNYGMPAEKAIYL
jgi:hypothetical protein